MPRTRPLILACALLASFGSPGAGEPGVASGLVRTAWYWQARARSDKAEEAWKRVLESAPDHPEALAAVGNFHARAGRLEQAREVLARLEKLAPNHPDVPVLRRAIQLGPRSDPLLSHARKLVHEGRGSEAAGAYRELFGDPGPPGDLALEYYQTVGASPGGWEEARAGLQRLVRRAPGEARFRLELGKFLTYREGTRGEGIAVLSALSKDATVGKEATASWRKALLWLAPSAQDIALLRAYARSHPGDQEIARRIQRGRVAGSVHDGYAALDRGDLRAAERLFQLAGDDRDARRGLSIIAGRRTLHANKAGFAALENGDLAAAEGSFRSAGDDPDARLGLALVAQRQGLLGLQEQDFARARERLERSKRLAPRRRDLWEQPLESAVFWGLVQDARAAREGGRDKEAEAKLLDAAGRAPEGLRWNAELALADLYAARRQPAKAEQRYRGVLAAVPDQPDALRALAGLLVEAGRLDEALPVNDRLVRVAPQKAFRPQWLQGEILRAHAARSRAARDPGRARSELEAARQADPSNVWTLHDLANVLLETGAIPEARELLADLLARAPSLPEARIAHARLLVAQGEHARALEVLSSMRPPPRDPAVIALRRRLEVQVKIPALLAAAAAGERTAAVQGMSTLQRQVEDDPSLTAHVAVGWSKLGERDRGVALMRAAMSKAPAATRGARLELASTLLDASDDAAAGQVLAGLVGDRSLTADEHRMLGELRVAHAIRTADRSRELGDRRTALATLDPVLLDYPNDPRLLAALARVLEHGLDVRKANGLFLSVLRTLPHDLDARRGAIETALALRDTREARELAAEGIRRHPREPRAHELAARAALQSGDDAAGMRSLEQALWLVSLTPDGPRRGEGAISGEGASSASVLEGRPRLASFSPEEDAALRAQILREMQRVRARHQPGLGGTLEARRREGEPGLSALTDLRQSLQAEVPVGWAGRFVLHVSEIELYAGALSSAAAPRFGSGARVALDQQAMGTGLRLAYESPRIYAELATTPLGFPIWSMLGTLRLRDSFGPFSVAIEGGRRNVTESLLSYAGAKDPATGRYWGGVVMEGGRADLRFATAPADFIGYGELHRLVGVRVQQNERLAGGFGIELKLWDGPWGDVRTGPGVSALQYTHNLRFFTVGHGGYFSPQRFVHGGWTFAWRRYGTVRWDVVAEPGYDAFQESAVAAFPLGGGTGTYAGQTNRGFSFNGHALLGVSIGGQFETGIDVGMLRAPQFQEVRASLVLRFGGGR